MATLGIVLVFAGSFSANDLLGNGYALLSSLALGANLTLLRRHSSLARMPLIALAGLVAALIALPKAQPFGLDQASYLALGLMGLLQMPLATLLINSATRYLPSAEVALFYLLESVLGTLWVWYFLSEVPARATLYGGALVITTLVVHAGFTLRARPALPA